MEDAIYGLTLQHCAEILSKDGELKAQHGEAAYKGHFQQYLSRRGWDENTWAHAWNGWWQRMQADASGQLYARFTTMQQQMSAQAKARRAQEADPAEAANKRAAQNLIDQKMEEQKQAQAQRAGAMRESGELAPFMGVSLESWAQAQAAITSGTSLEQILPSLGIDAGTWQQVSAEWNARMSRDTTATIATVYGQAFTGAGAGQFGAAGQATAGAMNPGGSVGGSEPPVPFEKWIEITVAQQAGTEKGEDPSAVLARFGITPADWGTIGGWWGQHFNANAMQMMDDYNRWTAHFERQYGVGHGDGLTSDEREEQTLATILDMARGGKAQQLVAFLKEKFPDDADDNDALDWWLDKACDMCGESGDQATAKQLLYVRYPLQEDEDDPMEEWVASSMEMLF